jgi:anaerobic ribonucleoside-triphosphate reductase
MKTTTHHEKVATAARVALFNRGLLVGDEELCINALVAGDPDRQPCEVWTRVMGYHRPVSEFNKGKKQEHKDRIMFREPKGESQ